MEPKSCGRIKCVEKEKMEKMVVKVKCQVIHQAERAERLFSRKQRVEEMGVSDLRCSLR